MTCAKKHVLVTGSATGIGRATVLALARSGYHVFAGIRRESGLDAFSGEPDLDESSCSTVLLDITDEGQRQQAVQQIAGHTQGHGGLDGLVNNAGIGVAQPLELVAADDLRRQFEVNVIAQLAMTQAALPLLRRARGRIVMIGSVGDRITLPFTGPLAASKSALASLNDALRQELAPWGISVVLVEPASIRTEATGKLQADNQRTLDAFTPSARALYGEAYRKFTAAALKQEQGGSGPEVVGELIARVMHEPRPRHRYLIGKHARLLAILAALEPVLPLDAIRRRILGQEAPGSRTAGPGS